MESRSLKGHVSLRELSAKVSQLQKENQSLKAKLAKQQQLTAEAQIEKQNLNQEIAWLEIDTQSREEKIHQLTEQLSAKDPITKEDSDDQHNHRPNLLSSSRTSLWTKADSMSESDEETSNVNYKGPFTTKNYAADVASGIIGKSYYRT